MSLNRSEQAKINGAKSRGPRTEAGKQKSAMNACKHGLTSSLVVQQNEDDEQFQLLLAAFTEKFQPADAVEQELVFEAAAARFQLRRAWALETAAIDRQMDSQRNYVESYEKGCSEETRIALAHQTLGDRSKTLALLSRYHSRIRRDFERAIRDLEHIRSSRTLTQPKLPNEPKTAPAAAKPAPFQIVKPELPNEPKPLAVSPVDPARPQPQPPAPPAAGVPLELPNEPGIPLPDAA